MKFELDYITGKTKPTDLAKLASESFFAGSHRIGLRTNLYERIDTIAVLAQICNGEHSRPVMIPVAALKLSRGA